jgi:hypothetical protein
MAARRQETATGESVDTVEQETPKLVLTMGRGKTGKSTFIRWAGERAYRSGRSPIIADGDRTNATLAAFFEGVARPPSPDPLEMKDWLGQLIESQIEERFNVLLDLGGGDLVWKEYARDLELVQMCEKYGVEPVGVHFLGCDLDDLAYLRDVEEGNVFAPRRTILVLNEGIVPANQSVAKAFDAIQNHDIYRAAIARGAKPIFMPRLGCMSEVDRRRLMFEDAEAGRVKEGQDKIGPINRQMIAIWRRAMDKAFADVADFLP